MSHSTRILLSCICGFLLIDCVTPSFSSPEERYNFFNIDLLQAVITSVPNNVIVSPASVKVALTALTEAAEGRTKRQLLSTLRLPADIQTTRSLSLRSLESLRVSGNGTEVDAQTLLWSSLELPVKNEYRNALMQFYGADLAPVDFKNTAFTVNCINSWVRNVTREKIQMIVEPGTLRPDTKLILTSSMYFKGQWKKSFDEQMTRERCFYGLDKMCHNTPIMENQGLYRFAYVPWLNAEVLEIPYSNGRFSMLFFLSKEEDLDQNSQVLSKDLAFIPISVLLSGLEETEVLVWIPKFSVESKLDLKPILTSMGISDLFDSNANLAGLADGPFKVSSMIQNARIDVDEAGTIAAAVTGLSVVPLMGSTVQAFRATRPFVFMIVDLHTNATIFAGRFMQPNVVNKM